MAKINLKFSEWLFLIGLMPLKPKEMREMFRSRLTGNFDLREADQICRLCLEEIDQVGGNVFALNEKELLPEKYEEVLQQLEQGIPVQYALGSAHFYGLKLKLYSSVLSPRPETEELVSWLLSEWKQDGLSLVDIGSGSACIALAVKYRRMSWMVTALDISDSALGLCKENSDILQLPLKTISADVLHDPVPEADIWVCNPPYIPQSESAVLSDLVLRNEPSLALFVPDEDPIIFYRHIVQQARKRTKVIYFEIHEDMELLLSKFLNSESLKFEYRKDMQDKLRMLKVELL
jgi:release factor glutamine methyltransferase